MSNEKREYIIKTLSRTKRKDYENYVINSIWHKIDNLSLKPVTQQYIKRADGKYGLLDLYFPQINFGIECDEAHHKQYEDEDLKRQLSMEEMLSTVAETSDFILRRVDVDNSIEDIEYQIRNIVSEIKKVCDVKQITPWNINEDIVKTVIERKYISIGDNFRFKRIIDVLKIFGVELKGYQRGIYYFDSNYSVWFPSMAIEKEGKKYSTNSYNWINYLSEDWNEIKETNYNNEVIMSNIKPDYAFRIVFAKTIDPLGISAYRYLGVYKFFELDKSSDVKIYRKVNEPIIYKNISFIQ